MVGSVNTEETEENIFERGCKVDMLDARVYVGT